MGADNRGGSARGQFRAAPFVSESHDCRVGDDSLLQYAGMAAARHLGAAAANTRHLSENCCIRTLLPNTGKSFLIVLKKRGSRQVGQDWLPGPTYKELQVFTQNH